MTVNNSEVKPEHKLDLEYYTRKFVYFFIVAISGSILAFITLAFLNDNLRAISFTVYKISVIVTLLPILLITLTVLLYILPLFFTSTKDGNFKKRVDYTTIVNESKKPTKVCFKLWKISVWTFFISAVLTLLASILYLVIIFLIS